MVYRKALIFRINGSPDIFILKLYRHGKLLPEYIQDPIASDKPYKMNISGRDTKSGRDLKILGKIFEITRYLLQRGLTLQGTVSVVFVMEALKPFGLDYDLVETLKVLGPEKGLVKDILELFYYAVSPGFSYGYKDRLYAKIKAKPYYKAE